MIFNNANINHLSLIKLFALLIVILCSLNIALFNIGVSSPYILLSSVLFLFSIQTCFYGVTIYKMNQKNVSFYFLIYWILAVISTLFTYPIKSLLANKEFVSHISYLLIYIYVSDFFFKQPVYRKLIIIAVSLISIPLTIEYWYIKIYGGGLYEGSGLLISSNLLAIYLVISIFILMQFFMSQKLLIWTLLAMFGVTIIDTGSRSAVLSLITAWLVTLSFQNSKKLKSKHFVLCIILVILLTGLLYMIRPESVKGRLLLWELGFSVINFRSILLGSGLGYLSEQLGEIQSVFYYGRSISDQLFAGEVKTILNEYLRILIEIGAIGLISFIIGLYFSIRILKDSTMYYLVGALVAVIFFSLTSYPLSSTPVCIITIVIIAFAASLAPKANLETIDLQFIKKTKKCLIIPIIFIVPISLLLCKTASYGVSLIKWHNLKRTLSIQYNEVKFHNMYQDLYKTLHHEPMFLTDYGEKLQALRYYKEADKLLKNAADIQPLSYRLILLGFNYQQLRQYDLAEISYKKASSILPKSFLPRYMLFELYRSLGNKDLAKSTATEIVLNPIKIPSYEVMEIKKEVIKYLNNNLYEEN